LNFFSGPDDVIQKYSSLTSPNCDVTRKKVQTQTGPDLLKLKLGDFLFLKGLDSSLAVGNLWLDKVLATILAFAQGCRSLVLCRTLPHLGKGSPNFFVRGPHKLLHNSPRVGRLT